MMTIDERIDANNRRIEEENAVLIPQIEANKTLYTVSEIQDILEIGQNSAYQLVKSGHFKCMKIGGQIRIIKKSFDEWLDGFPEGGSDEQLAG